MPEPSASKTNLYAARYVYGGSPYGLWLEAESMDDARARASALQATLDADLFHYDAPDDDDDGETEDFTACSLDCEECRALAEELAKLDDDLDEDDLGDEIKLKVNDLVGPLIYSKDFLDGDLDEAFETDADPLLRLFATFDAAGRMITRRKTSFRPDGSMESESFELFDPE